MLSIECLVLFAVSAVFQHFNGDILCNDILCKQEYFSKNTKNSLVVHKTPNKTNKFYMVYLPVVVTSIEQDPFTAHDKEEPRLLFRMDDAVDASIHGISGKYCTEDTTEILLGELAPVENEYKI